jgi:hypothetical protein
VCGRVKRESAVALVAIKDQLSLFRKKKRKKKRDVQHVGKGESERRARERRLDNMAALDVLRFLVEHQTSVLSTGCLTSLEAANKELCNVIRTSGAWYRMVEHELYGRWPRWSAALQIDQESALQIRVRDILTRMLDIDERMQAAGVDHTPLKERLDFQQWRSMLPTANPGEDDHGRLFKMLVRTVLFIRHECAAFQVERVLELFRRTDFSFSGCFASEMSPPFASSMVITTEEPPLLKHFGLAALRKLLIGRTPMLHGDGSLICTDPTFAPTPWLAHAPPEGLSFFLDLASRVSSAESFSPTVSARMLWMHKANRLEVENDDWDPEADWVDDDEDDSGRYYRGGYSPDPSNWHSDETHFDALAACNFAPGLPGRPSLSLPVRANEVLLIEIKLTGQLEPRKVSATQYKFDASRMENGLFDGLFFSRVVTGQTLRGLYDAGDMYDMSTDGASTSPGEQGNGSRTVCLFSYWAENVKKRELSELHSVHDDWYSFPGLKYTSLTAEVRMADGMLFVDDVHFTFPSTSGMGQGVFDGGIELSLPIARPNERNAASASTSAEDAAPNDEDELE